MALLNLIVLTILLGFLYKNANGAGKFFNQFYSPLWGLNHLTVNPQGTEVQLLMDQSSGKFFHLYNPFHISMHQMDESKRSRKLCEHLI